MISVTCRLKEVAEFDPPPHLLRDLHLIASPSDPYLLPRNGIRGFPHWGVWAQWNDRFSSDIGAFVGDNQKGMLSAVATRITGEWP
jgi:pullulanase/glycogen debranching enzyme